MFSLMMLKPLTSMKLSREFVERLSEILFNEKMMDNIPHDKHYERN
jgi:hypothetical protein